MKDFPQQIITFLSTLPKNDIKEQHVAALRLYGAGHILHGIKVARMDKFTYNEFVCNTLKDIKG